MYNKEKFDKIASACVQTESPDESENKYKKEDRIKKNIKTQIYSISIKGTPHSVSSQSIQTI